MVDRMQSAISAVRQGRLSARRAAEEFQEPRSTLGDRLNGTWKTTVTGPARQLTDVEEEALVFYVTYMNKHGFPLTRAITRCFIREIIKTSGRHTLMNLETGPSDRWFRKSFARHPQLVERKPQDQDRSRAAMSTEAVLQQFFERLKDVLIDGNIFDKPSRIFNCDETGWTGKETSKTKVIGSMDSAFKRLKVATTDHITGHLCVSADGRFLPTMVIFKGSLPHRNCKDGVPDEWLFATSESGYMDTSLFIQWFTRIFVPNCGRERPVLLVMDNHDSHISLPCIEEALANDIILLGLPAHTTHLLQPLDIIGPLKNRFSALSANLGFTSSLTIGKSKFPLVLRYAIDQARPASVRAAFEACGICPFRPSAIAVDTLPSKHQQDTETYMKETETCNQCGQRIQNPLVSQGLIPASLASILVPPPTKVAPDMRRRRLVTEARVFTGAEMLQALKDKEEKARKEKEDKEKRRELATERRAKREREQQEKMLRKKKKEEEKDRKKKEDKLRGGWANEMYVCAVCGERV